MKSVHVTITGRVQGVFFRDYTVREARERSLRGWVRNLPDGSVDSVLTGQDSAVDSMIEWFREGSPLSQVESVAVDEILETEKLRSFTVRY